jgi:Domain of unknown function (DUF4399)
LIFDFPSARGWLTSRAFDCQESIMRLFALVSLAALFLAVGSASGSAADQIPGAQPPQFVGVKDGDTLANPVTVHFRLPEMPADAAMLPKMSGMTHGAHLHLLIDSPLPKPGEMVPVDSRHKHLMHGETQVTLQLPPGTHHLQLLMAGANHVVGNPPVASQVITVHVVARTAAPTS